MANKAEIKFQNGVAMVLAKHAFEHTEELPEGYIFGPTLYVQGYTGKVNTGIRVDNATTIDYNFSVADPKYQSIPWTIGIALYIRSQGDGNARLMSGFYQNSPKTLGEWGFSLEAGKSYTVHIDTAASTVTLNGITISYPPIDFDAEIYGDFECGYNNGKGAPGMSIYVNNLVITTKGVRHKFRACKYASWRGYEYGLWDMATNTFLGNNSFYYNQYQKF